jgi:pentatricopeptide repeat protein
LIRLQAKVGHLDTALELWQQMYQQSENEAIREIAQREIRKLQEELKRTQAAKPNH